MNRKSLLSLLSVLVLTLAATGAVAVEPSEQLAEPTAPSTPVPDPGSVPALGCSESPGGATAQMSLEPGPSPAGDVDVLASQTSWWYGICWTSCYPCWSNDDCPWGETCRFNVQCP